MVSSSSILVVASFAIGSAIAGSGGQSIDLYNEFYGRRAYTDPAAVFNLANGMATGLSFSPPVDSGLTRFMTDHKVDLMITFPGAALSGGLSADSIETERAALVTLADSLPDQKVIWNLMSEWDQSGGSWVAGGRPTYVGLNKRNAYLKFCSYYSDTLYPLSAYLRVPPEQRPYTLAAVTDHPSNIYRAYEMGVDLSLLERGIDELSDISTGIAFARGAARQYGRQWGIELSTWRTSAGSATQFDSKGNLTGGWSPSYLKRHYYISYMSGAQVLRNEAAVYYSAAGQLNPFGQMAKEFADFARNRHPDVGTPVVPTALLIDQASGFDPKHWIYNQTDTVWYGDIPYSDGDSMINNFFKLAWPNHWAHGLTPGAPFVDAQGKPDATGFRQFLANGGDPRPFEPMTYTRWGDSFDIITNRASLDTLRQYKLIILLGDISVDATLQLALQAWVESGGVLVMNINQARSAVETLAGVTPSRVVRTGNSSVWLADGTAYAERPFQYTLVTPVTATVLATNGGSNPLVTSNTVGSGKVILTTPRYLQTAARDQLLGIGTRLFDWLEERFAVASVSGPPVEYIVNQTNGSLIVTLLNHSGTEWNGSISFETSGPVSAVREYTTDQEFSPVTTSGTTSRVAAQVPPYDLRIYAVEFSNH